jgi:uncharacterized iron-regulated membrane protein
MALGLKNLIIESQTPYKLEHGISRDNVFPDRALSNIITLHPTLELKALFFPSDSSQSLRTLWTKADLLQDQTFFSDPETGTLLSDSDSKWSEVFSWILKVHRGTLTGVSGKFFISILGVLLFLLWPTGVLIRFSKTKMPRRTWLLRKKNTTQSLHFHRSVGFFGGFLISFMGLSGSLLNFNKDLIKAIDPVPTHFMKSSIKGIIRALPSPAFLEKAITSSSLARPNSQIQSIHFSRDSKNDILFYFKDSSRVYLDSDSGQIKKVMSPQSSWIHLLYPLHSGRIFGPFHLAVSWATGLLLLALIVTGFRKSRKALTTVPETVVSVIPPLLHRAKAKRNT